jgi:CRP-like cAMP-binding protein
MPLRRELETIDDLKSLTRIMPAGSELYRQGEPCDMYFVVLRGWIALSSLLDDGGCQILDFAIPGAFLGFPLGSHAPMYHSARCVTPVQVRSYPRQPLNNAVGRNSHLAFLLCQLAVSDASRAHEHLVNLGLRSAPERVAHLLLELYVRLVGRVPVIGGETVQLPLTQCHIGQAVGLSGVHVCRVLRMLREQGIAQLVNQNLKILNPEALIRIAGLERQICKQSLESRGTLHLPRELARAGAGFGYRVPVGWEFQPSDAVSC